MAQPRRVLIIEDEPSTLNLLAHIVRQAGYEPVLAKRGREGLRLLRELGADLILLDLMLRDVDGWSVLLTIKADHRMRTVPVVIVSARAPLKMDPYTSLYADYIIKPFDVDGLVLRIGEILEAGPEEPPSPEMVDSARPAGILRGAKSTESIFEMAITAEIAARNLYRGLAARFAHVPAAAQFWKGMMHDEEAHAEQLERLRASLTAEQLAAPAQPSLWRRAAASYDLATQSTAESIRTLEDAYQVAHRLESSEINAIFEILMIRYLEMEHKEEIILSQIRDHTAKMVQFAQLFGEAPVRQQVSAGG